MSTIKPAWYKPNCWETDNATTPFRVALLYSPLALARRGYYRLRVRRNEAKGVIDPW